MAGITFGLANYNTGDRILDLPVKAGASWAAFLNKPDSLSCDLDMRDADVQALDIPSSTEPKKTVLFAEDSVTEAILAWGVISDRTWNNDARALHIEASGAGQYFNQRIIAPPAAATGTIVLPDGSVSAAFDTLIDDVSLGSIGVALVAQALSWPGAPTAYVLPAPVADIGRTSGTYRLVDYKKIWPALEDLTKRADGGPDFAFDARRDSTGLALEYVMRAGAPFLGSWIGSWSVGAPESPVTDLVVKDDGGSLGTHIWMQAGRTDSKVLVARVINQTLIDLSGYPVLDFVDTTHTDVTLQATLDDYADENAVAARRLLRDVSFTVKGRPMSLDGQSIGPALGQYRPGDWMGLDVGSGNLYLREGRIDIRITSMSGDETGDDIKIGCDVGSMA